MKHEIATSIHHFKEPISDKRRNSLYYEDELVVTLEINHTEKTYSIFPQYYMDKNHTRFFFNRGNSTTVEKWTATMKAMQAANDYAQEELFGNKPQQP